MPALRTCSAHLDPVCAMMAFDLSLPDSIPDDRYRRRIGLLLGGLLGLTYALFPQVGNRLLLPGVPLYQPPFGALLNLLVFALGGALLGILVASPRSGVKGVLLVAAGSAAVIVLFSLAAAEAMAGGLAVQVLAAFSLTLPFWGMLVPIFAVTRWVIDHQEESRRDGQPWRRRFLRPLALIVVVAVVGYTTVYPELGRQVLQAAHGMLSEAATTGETPAPLADVAAFPTHRSQAYRLFWESNNIERFRIPRPGRNFDQHTAAIARYPDGWHLVCIYIAPDEPPLCQGFDVLPQ